MTVKDTLDDKTLASVKEAVAKIVSEELSLEEAATQYSIDESILSTFVEEVQGEKLKDAAKKSGYDDGSVENDNPKVEGASELENGSKGSKKGTVKEEVEVAPLELHSKVTKEDISEDVKEHMDAFFKGEELSEEFRNKVSAIFESAVINTAQKIITANVAKLEENLQEQVDAKITVLEESTEEYKESLNKKVDEYLSYVVEEWVTENKPAVQSTIRSDLTESFIVGLKGLFEEHYIDIPEEKVNIVEDYAKKLDETENEVASLMEQVVNLRREKNEIIKTNIVEKVSDGLSDGEKERFAVLTESIDFKDADGYAKAIETIRESYFDETTPTVTGVEEGDTPIELAEDVTAPVVEEKAKASHVSAAEEYMRRSLKTRK